MSSSYGYTKPSFMITDHSRDPYHLPEEEEAVPEDDNDAEEERERNSKLQELTRWLHFNARHRRKR